MTKIHHPSNRFERLNVEQKKAQKRLRSKERNIRARLAREALKVKELEDAVSSGEVG